MALLDLWKASRTEIETKRISQILAFAGTGKLADGNLTSLEFRDYLATISSELLSRYAKECLEENFQDRGFVLQDLVNEIGRRLGFKVQNGRYRGTVADIGFDGLWQLPDSLCIIVEVKISDAYSIEIDRTIQYRTKLENDNLIDRGKGSVLYVVGGSDTSSFESQIRGSRYAWDVRLISVDSLLRLMSLKKEIEDPNVINQIANILIPREYTRVDSIIDLVFYTTQDVKIDVEIPTEEEVNHTKTPGIEFRTECIEKLSKYLQKPFIQMAKTIYQSVDGTTISCAISKSYDSSSGDKYWFAFHPSQLTRLNEAKIGFVSFGCGSADKILLIPMDVFRPWLEILLQTISETRQYWHVHISQKGDQLFLDTTKDHKSRNITKYLIPNP